MIRPLNPNRDHLPVLQRGKMSTPIRFFAILVSACLGLAAFPAYAQTGADLQLTKNASNTPVPPGNDIGFDIIVQNSGPDPATNVVVIDTLPTNSTFVFATTNSGAVCTESAGTVTCPLGTIDVGFFDTIHIELTPAGVGDYDNTATVTAAETRSAVRAGHRRLPDRLQQVHCPRRG